MDREKKEKCPKENSWIKHYWRPAMAYQYLAVCVFDFVLFPLLTMVYFNHTGESYIPWSPITLQESGFYHLAMGAILGVSAWTRGQEKIKNIYSGNVRESSYISQTPYDRSQFPRQHDDYAMQENHIPHENHSSEKL